jgi:chemotaxis response regulator CheB
MATQNASTDSISSPELVKQIIARHPDISLRIAVDGYSGIEIACAYLPNVILMDIDMPGVNGQRK